MYVSELCYNALNKMTKPGKRPDKSSEENDSVASWTELAGEAKTDAASGPAPAISEDVLAVINMLNITVDIRFAGVNGSITNKINSI